MSPLLLHSREHKPDLLKDMPGEESSNEAKNRKDVAGDKIELPEESVKEEIVSSADKANDEKEITTAEDPETGVEERQEAVSKRYLDYDHDNSHFEETKRLMVREE